MDKRKKCMFESNESSWVPRNIDEPSFDDGKTVRGYWRKDNLPACVRFERLDDQIKARGSYFACGQCYEKCAFYKPRRD